MRCSRRPRCPTRARRRCCWWTWRIATPLPPSWPTCCRSCPSPRSAASRLLRLCSGCWWALSVAVSDARSVGGRTADNPRLVARVRASGQGWRQNKFDNVRRTVTFCLQLSRAVESLLVLVSRFNRSPWFALCWWAYNFGLFRLVGCAVRTCLNATVSHRSELRRYGVES